MIRIRKPLIAVALTAAAYASLGAGSALAHPLGNFSVNHLNRLTFSTERVVDDATMDSAEIPTAQAEADVDRDGDGQASPSELSAYAALRCTAWRDDLALSVDGAAALFEVTQSVFEYRPGQAGLKTSRLDCRFEASVAVRGRSTVEFFDRHLADRVGWKEITAVGDGAGTDRVARCANQRHERSLAISPRPPHLAARCASGEL